MWNWVRPDIDLSTAEGAARAVGETARQALMVSYTDTFWLLGVLGIVCAPLVLIIRKPKGGWAQRAADAPAQHAE